MTFKSEAVNFWRRRLSLLVLLAALLASSISYFVYIPKHPPGFYFDESSISYNAYLISQTGKDEFGVSWPVYFRAFGDNKNPIHIYLLAALFRVTGPSIFVARLLSALLGIATAVLIGLLAFRITQRGIVGLVLVVTTLETPWLFELSRVVLEVSLYPLVVILFLLAVFRASKRSKWSWKEIVFLAITLALISYTYSIGRLLGPLLAVGLVIFVTRQRIVGLLLTWGFYALTLVPMVSFQRRYPGALMGRFSIITYLNRNNPPINSLWEFIKHYFGNLNPWRLFVSGDPNRYQFTHIYGTELLLAVTAILVVGSLFLILLYYRQDNWWRFVIYATVVSVVPASLTIDDVHTLRLAPLAVFFMVLSIPALNWIIEQNYRRVLLLLVICSLIQGTAYQWRFHKAANLPVRMNMLDDGYPDKVLGRALASTKRPIYLVDAQGTPGYIQAYWYATLRDIPISDFVYLPPDAAPPLGALVISTESWCARCEIIAQNDLYSLYVVTGLAPERKPLAGSDLRAGLRPISFPSRVKTGEQFVVRVAVRNDGNAVWLARERTGSPFQVGLGNHWLDHEGRVVINDDGRSPVLRDIRPGQELEMSLTVNAPNSPGDFVLEIDVVQEGVSWFGLRGSPTVRVPIQVERHWW